MLSLIDLQSTLIRSMGMTVKIFLCEGLITVTMITIAAANQNDLLILSTSFDKEN